MLNFSCRYLNPEDAVKAQAENGVLFEGHHLRVHSCAMNTNPDETKAIFIGNLNFGNIFKQQFNKHGFISHF